MFNDSLVPEGSYRISNCNHTENIKYDELGDPTEDDKGALIAVPKLEVVKNNHPKTFEKELCC